MERMGMSSASDARKIKGVDFVVDENGEKKAVLIDLKRHRLLWEDFYDTALAKEREREPRESLEDVKRKVLGTP
jgi:hypothetical protein